MYLFFLFRRSVTLHNYVQLVIKVPLYAVLVLVYPVWI